MPNIQVQKKLAKFGIQTQKLLKPAEKFNKWLDSNGHGVWYKKLAIFLGASLGQIAVTGVFDPHAYIGLAIGGALLLGGLTTGAILAAARADKGKGLRSAGTSAIYKRVR